MVWYVASGSIQHLPTLSRNQISAKEQGVWLRGIAHKVFYDVSILQLVALVEKQHGDTAF